MTMLSLEQPKHSNERVPSHGRCKDPKRHLCLGFPSTREMRWGVWVLWISTNGPQGKLIDAAMIKVLHGNRILLCRLFVMVWICRLRHVTFYLWFQVPGTGTGEFGKVSPLCVISRYDVPIPPATIMTLFRSTKYTLTLKTPHRSHDFLLAGLVTQLHLYYLYSYHSRRDAMQGCFSDSLRPTAALNRQPLNQRSTTVFQSLVIVNDLSVVGKRIGDLLALYHVSSTPP